MKLKNKFNKGRGYKVVKIFVIILTIFFVFKWWSYGANGFINVTLLEKAYDQCDLSYANDNNNARRDVCYEAAKREFIKPPNYSNQNLLFVILIPLFFFGGTWLYKYLFPIKESSDKHKGVV